MALAYDENFARVTSVDGSRVELAFDLDHARWPWLGLPPQHPVLLEKYHYFGTLTGFWAISGTDPSLQTALTQISWRCDALEQPALAERGVCSHEREGGSELLRLELLTGAGERSVVIDALGVVFANRDFAKWRAKTRAEALAARDGVTMPELAPPEQVGLGPDGRALVSMPDEVEGKRRCMALVGDDAFHPRHPFHTGSGDHVNAGHLFDCALQAAHLALGARAPRQCTALEARFGRYVELDIPFEIEFAAADDRRVTMSMRQLGHDAAQLELSF